MAKKSIKYSSKKIKEINVKSKKELGKFLRGEFNDIQNYIEKNNDTISQHLKNYYIIHFVTIIENHLIN